MTSIPQTIHDMAYREKLAWLSLVALAVTLGPYLTLSALDVQPQGSAPELGLITRLGIALVSYALILGAGHLVLRWRFVEEARAGADERDLAIERKALRIAYFALTAGMIVVGIVMPFDTGGWDLVNAAIAAIFVAEAIHYGVAVWSYRRG